MINREKVIRALEYCSQGVTGCKVCIYRRDFGCRSRLAADVLALLKEQEPKTGKWILDDDDANLWECSECGDLQQIIDGTPHENDWYFCPHCGSRLDELEPMTVK